MKNRFSYTVITLFFLFVLNGQNSFSSERVSDFSNTETVLIFKKNPLANKNKKNSFYTSNHLRYYDQNLIYREREIYNINKADTIKISTNDKFLPVDLFHNYVTYNYFFNQADTVYFSFEKDIPVVVSNDKEQKYDDLNFSLNYKKRFNKPLKVNGVFAAAGQSKLTAKQEYLLVYADYHNQSLYLDSLSKRKLLSEEIAGFFLTKNKFDFAAQIFNNPKFKPFVINTIDDHNIVEMLNNEDLIRNDYFNKFIIWNYLWSSELGIKRIRHAQGISLDYKQAYEVVKTKFTNLKIKNHLLFFCLQMIHSEDPALVYQNFLEKFKKQDGVSHYVSYLEENFGTDLKVSIGSSVLTNISKTKKVEFAIFLKSLKGNVVYIDLWASWCQPCRAAMPHSKSLAKSFQNDKVKFIYISIDEKFTEWSDAAAAEGLKSNQLSFLLLAPKTASFPKSINLKTIPRYLIYDKNGKLVHMNAPSPASAETKNLLRKYLLE